jgi:hypothetical protein
MLQEGETSASYSTRALSSTPAWTTPAAERGALLPPLPYSESPLYRSGNGSNIDPAEDHPAFCLKRTEPKNSAASGRRLC